MLFRYLTNMIFEAKVLFFFYFLVHISFVRKLLNYGIAKFNCVILFRNWMVLFSGWLSTLMFTRHGSLNSQDKLRSRPRKTWLRSSRNNRDKLRSRPRKTWVRSSLNSQDKLRSRPRKTWLRSSLDSWYFLDSLRFRSHLSILFSTCWCCSQTVYVFLNIAILFSTCQSISMLSMLSILSILSMLFFDTSMLFWHVDAVLKRQCFSQHVNEFSTCQYFSWYTNALLNILKLFLTYQCFSQHVDTCQSWRCPDKNCEVLVCFVGFDSFTQKKKKNTWKLSVFGQKSWSQLVRIWSLSRSWTRQMRWRPPTLIFVH